MNKIFNTYLPEGFSNVNTYLFTENPVQLIEFLKDTFFAQEISRTMNDDHTIIRNCIVKIGNTCFMLAQAQGQFMAMRTSLYLYVDDVDLIFEQAVKHGAEVVFEPADMDYGDRQGGVIDPAGNYWWISKRLVDHNYGT